MTFDELKELMVRKCTNLYRATNVVKGQKQPMRYQRTDLTEWAAEAYANGEQYFYADYINPDDPTGGMVLAEPNYEYNLGRNLSEEEYLSLFGDK